MRTPPQETVEPVGPEREPEVMRVVGLDVHPTLFTVAEVVGRNAQEAKASWVVDRRPLDQLEQVLRKRTQPGDTVVLEATGNAFAVAARVAQCERRAVVLNSDSVSDLGRKYCGTDKEDALKLGRVWLTGLAKVVWQPDGRTADYRHIFFAYQNAVCDAVRARNRIWAFLDAHCLKRPRTLRLDQPEALTALLRLRSWSEVEQEILVELVSVYDAATTRRHTLETRIAKIVTTDKTLLRLTRLTGVRHVVAFALFAFIGDVHRFKTPKSLAAYFGLTPSVLESGQNRRLRSPGLSHTGRSDVRALLVQGAQSVLRYGTGPLTKWGVQLKMRRGTNVAVIAVARKMAVQVWYLLMGYVPDLLEVTETLRLKLHRIAAVIGLKNIQDLGYTSIKAFEDEKIALLTKTA